MPNRVKDPHSGAIIFVPTNEEIEIAELKKRVSKLEKAQNASLPMEESVSTEKANHSTKKNE